MAATLRKGTTSLEISCGTRYSNLVTTGTFVSNERINGKRNCNTVECICDCGNLCYKSVPYLRSGRSTCCSIKCVYHGKVTHNLSKTKEFRAFAGMINRCADLNNINYGGKGVTYDEELSTMIGFIEHVGMAPSKYHRFERIDKEGNFEVGNVHWNLCKSKKGMTHD